MEEVIQGNGGLFSNIREIKLIEHQGILVLLWDSCLSALFAVEVIFDELESAFEN